jgi:hypothetical protein
LASGVYFLTKPILKKGLIFEQKDQDKKVYIIGNEGPVINVVLNPGDTVIFKKIIFMHSGNNMMVRFKENAPNEPKYVMKPCKKSLAEFEIQPMCDTIAFVHQGGLIMKDCVLNMRSLPKNLKSKLSCVIAMPETEINFNNCEFLGNETNHDCGIISLNADSTVSSCSFS